jgi:hypothetical protein
MKLGGAPDYCLQVLFSRVIPMFCGICCLYHKGIRMWHCVVWSVGTSVLEYHCYLYARLHSITSQKVVISIVIMYRYTAV